MLTLRALELVHTHRTGIDAHMDRAVALLQGDPEEVRYPLARARWRLVEHLREYHLFKCVEIFAPAMRSGSIAEAREAERMMNACREGWEAFTEYALYWSCRDVAAMWPTYKLAMRDMTDRLHEHVASEEAHVERLLFHAPHTRHLAS